MFDCVAIWSLGVFDFNLMRDCMCGLGVDDFTELLDLLCYPFMCACVQWFER